MAPYASPIDRARALYRIPTAPARNRTLELCCHREPVVLARPWRGSEHACLTIGAPALTGSAAFEGACRFRQADPSAPLPFASQSFDLIVLHRVLDDLAASSQRGMFDAQKLLMQLAKVLVPGGVVAGCLQNRHGLASIIGRARRRLGMTTPLEAAAYSSRGLGDVLQRAGFIDVRIFSVLPSSDSPLRLVDSDPRISRLMFRHEVNAGRSQFLPFLMRRLAVELGLYRGVLTRSLFFWAYKPC
jgi:SAM-dependent methyltransferase